MEMLKFLTTVGKLKRLKRTGWVNNNIEDPETVAGHMYRMSIMAMVINPSSELRRDHCIKMCLVHDMAESIVGDITPYDGVSDEEKHKREVDAMTHLCSLLDCEVGEQVKDLFMEYENQETPEAKFVKDLDKFDMILQAHHYEQEVNKPGMLEQFFSSVDGKFQDSAIKDLAEKLKNERKP